MAFNAKGVLDQLLKAGQQTLQGSKSTRSGRGDDLNAVLGKTLSSGSLAGGALGLLLGRKRRRGFGGGMLRRGGAAVIGTLAYRAYKEWQAQNAQDTGEPRTLDRVSGAEAERQSLAILKAMVAAAKADREVDARERALLDAEMAKGGADPDLKQWLDRELREPVDPADVAAAAESPEVAAEMYLASRLVIDAENYMEKGYLDELARHLKLAPELRAQLDRQADQAEAE